MECSKSCTVAVFVDSANCRSDGDDLEQELFAGRTGAMFGANAFASNPQLSLQKQTSSGTFGAGTRSAVPEPRSSQKKIVESRKDHVSQQFGQITPPEENGSGPFKAPNEVSQGPSQEPNKLSNEQRARNAANTRHSRTKNAKSKSDQKDADSDGEASQKQGKNITLQREKNRVAAAKCRAKKKSANEQQEELASQYGSTNNYLTREIRELKNQKTELQNYLLAHRPGVCECHGIHDYNFGQAQRLVLNARRHVLEPELSPSRESMLSGQSPGSEASGMFSGQENASTSASMGMPSRHPSFQNSMAYAFAQGVQGESQVGDIGTRSGQLMAQEFADFLQSSPGGRAGFS